MRRFLSWAGLRGAIFHVHLNWSVELKFNIVEYGENILQVSTRAERWAGCGNSIQLRLSPKE